MKKNMLLILGLIGIGTGCQKSDSTSPSVQPFNTVNGKWVVTNQNTGVSRYAIFTSTGMYQNYATAPHPNEPTEQYFWKGTISTGIEFCRLADSLNPVWIPVIASTMGIDQLQLVYNGTGGMKSISMKKVAEETCPGITGFQASGTYSIILQGNLDFMLHQYIRTNMGLKSYNPATGEVVLTKQVNQQGHYITIAPFHCDSVRFEFVLGGWQKK